MIANRVLFVNMFALASEGLAVKVV